MSNYPHPLGAERRRGPFRAGERVQLTDTKGRKYTTLLTHDGYFQSQRGNFRHRELIGKPEGTVFETETGHVLQALRPLVADYVLSMPRGATPVYPKDSGQIIQQGDIFPGAKVFEAGVGSGGLSLSLLAAIGPEGHLTSCDRRYEFAEIAQANVESWYGPAVPPWDLYVGDANDALDEMEAEALDHVVLDMLAPWEIISHAARALRSGGVIVGYVTTTTQLSRFVEKLRDSECFTEPEAFETMLRTWHLDGLAVRPNHSMVGHTGFLVVARRIARGSQPLIPKRRPAPAARPDLPEWENWDPADMPDRVMSDKKLRKVRRDVAHRADVEQSGTSESGQNAALMRAKLDQESTDRNRRRLQERRQARTEEES
ncbi:tRNA (adenine-N1)-methyltransferase [Trueperella pecoris]|uniref:tRNA (Adenine-N1)-methyltransferase n=1 Tax=Trueperella pecoris TaxID=2733571 RepID=A0A7M1QU99_9ACTO|nr:tRNA (adenine-N1)-methyltransferase [Trueperella pecoris]QOR44717.1 tRNA (adenine-N1)-methyltransferase [Trueperella pecoris]